MVYKPNVVTILRPRTFGRNPKPQNSRVECPAGAGQPGPSPGIRRAADRISEYIAP